MGSSLAPLGPWQDGWDTWGEVEDTIKTLSHDHFQTTLLQQILEVREQLGAGDLEHAAKEMNDIISVTLNWMRLIGLAPEDIASIAQSRSKLRYEGQAKDIITKYCTRYGI